MNNKQTMIAYRCTYCGSVIWTNISESMLDKPFKLPCVECKKSTLELEKTPDAKIKLTVPCLMCPHPHPYTISEEMFFSRSVYTFPCSFTGLDICFIGTDEDAVDEEIDATAALIREMISDEDASNDSDKRKNAGMMVADTSVMREVLFAIGKLDEEKKISCKCGSKAVKVLIDYDKANVVCKVCANSTHIPARTRFDANNAIDLDEIFIS